MTLVADEQGRTGGDAYVTEGDTPMPVDQREFKAFLLKYLDGRPATKTLYAKAKVAYEKEKNKTQSNQNKDEEKRVLSDDEINKLIAEDALAADSSDISVDSFASRMLEREVNAIPDNLALGAKVLDKAGTPSKARYSGINLVDENGNITKRTNYDTSGNDALLFFNSLPGTTKKLEFLNSIQSHNYYGTGKISSLAKTNGGLQNADIAAINGFLETASIRYGLTGEAFFSRMQGVPTTYLGSGSGSGGGASFPSKEDTASDVRSAWFKYLGRAPTKAEVEVAVSRISADYRAKSAGGGEMPTSLAVSTRNEAERAVPADAGAYTLGSAMDRLFKTMGG